LTQSNLFQSVSLSLKSDVIHGTNAQIAFKNWL
jgi:hypothetical protein